MAHILQVMLLTQSQVSATSTLRTQILSVCTVLPTAISLCSPRGRHPDDHAAHHHRCDAHRAFDPSHWGCSGYKTEMVQRRISKFEHRISKCVFWHMCFWSMDDLILPCIPHQGPCLSSGRTLAVLKVLTDLQKTMPTGLFGDLKKQNKKGLIAHGFDLRIWKEVQSCRAFWVQMRDFNRQFWFHILKSDV